MSVPGRDLLPSGTDKTLVACFSPTFPKNSSRIHRPSLGCRLDGLNLRTVREGEIKLMSEEGNSTQGNGALGSKFTPTRIILGLGGLAAAIASIFGLYKLVFPGPPPTAGGELLGIVVDSGSKGVYVTFEAVVEGYSGQNLEVLWTLFDYESRAVVADPKYQNQHAEYITPSRYRDEGTAQFMVPSPDRPGTYFVRLKLLPPEESGQNAPLHESNSEAFVVTSGQDLEQQVTDSQKETSIQNTATPASQAPEGVVPVSPEFDADAASAEEAAVINAAIEYYQYAEIGDYNTTYDLLSSQSQAYYTQDEWARANTVLDSAASEYAVTDAYPHDLGLDTSTYAVTLTVYLPDGSSFNRTTYFIYEAGFWAHHLTSEEIDLFDGAL
jgi:hypothetical protein